MPKELRVYIVFLSTLEFCQYFEPNTETAWLTAGLIRTTVHEMPLLSLNRPTGPDLSVADVEVKAPNGRGEHTRVPRMHQRDSCRHCESNYFEGGSKFIAVIWELKVKSPIFHKQL